MSLQLMKCFFLEDCIDLLGHEIQPDRLDILTKAADAIRGPERATNVTELKSFLGRQRISTVGTKFRPRSRKNKSWKRTSYST